MQHSEPMKRGRGVQNLGLELPFSICLVARARSHEGVMVNVHREIVVETLFPVLFILPVPVSPLSLPFVKQIPKIYLKSCVCNLCKLKSNGWSILKASFLAGTSRLS